MEKGPPVLIIAIIGSAFKPKVLLIITVKLFLRSPSLLEEKYLLNSAISKALLLKYKQTFLNSE